MKHRTPENKFYTHFLQTAIKDLFLPVDAQKVRTDEEIKQLEKNRRGPRGPKIKKNTKEQLKYNSYCAWTWFDKTADPKEQMTFPWVCNVLGYRMNYILDAIETALEMCGDDTYGSRSVAMGKRMEAVFTILFKMYDMDIEYKVSNGNRRPMPELYREYGKKVAWGKVRALLMGVDYRRPES